MISLFLGYESNDEKIVNGISPILKALGINVWEYKSSLKMSDIFTQEIEQTIERSADGAMFIISKNTLSSKYTLEIEVPKAIRRMRQDAKFFVFFLIYKADYSILKSIPAQVTDVYSKIIYDFDFSNLLEISSEILHKMLSINIGPKTDSIQLKVSDRGNMNLDEEALLNCDLAEVLGRKEQITLKNWEKIQKIISKLKGTLSKITSNTQIIFDAKLRYCSSFLFGYTFRQTTGFTFQLEYMNQNWSTPTTLKSKYNYLQKPTPSISRVSKNLIVDISLTHPNSRVIDTYLNRYPDQLLEKDDSRIILILDDLPNRSSVENEEMAQNIPLQIYEEVLTTINEYSCETVHIFYNGPYQIILFLGWLWNKGPRLFLYEYNGEEQTYYKKPYQVIL